MTNYYQTERQSYFYGFGKLLTPTIKLLLLVNVAVFFVQLLLWNVPTIIQVFGLIPARFTQQWALWQPVTGLFLHANLWQLLMDLLVLWFFAPDVEFALGGGRKLFSFYLTCGILSNVAAALLAPRALTPILGPGGAIFGILSAYATLFPQRVITLLLFFVIPVQLKAKYLVLIFGLIEWLGLMEGKFSQIFRYACLAGIPTGFFLVRARGGSSPVRRFLDLLGIGKFSRRQSREEYIRKKIDPILEKIAHKGMQSLSWREKRILRKAKTKIKPV